MSRSVTIPNDYDPFVVYVNNQVYSYKAGTTQTVQDEVAVVIDNYKRALPKQEDRDGAVGQVWTRTANGAEWKAEWKNVPTYTLPSASASAIGGVKKGVAVADAASTAPTAAEFKALLDSLRGAGVIATAQ